MPKEKDEAKAIRTITCPIPYNGFKHAVFALAYESKNLYNTCVFLINQVHTAYKYDDVLNKRKLKDKLHPNQELAIAEFNAVIDSVNAARQAKTDEENKTLEDDKKKTPKLLSRLESEVGNLFASLLDATVLDNVAKNHFDQHGNLVYRKLPAAVTQQTVASVRDAWKGYFASIKIHSVDDSGFTGRPKYPGYLNKHGTYPVEIPYQMLSNKTGGFPKPRVVADIDKADVEQLERFYDVDFKSLIQEACVRRGFDDYQIQHVRIVGKTVKEMKIEAVINLNRVFPEGSLLKQLYTEHGEAIREFKRNKDRLNFIRDWLSGKEDIALVGLDFGVRNLVTCAFSTGNRGIVHSGERYASHINNFDELIDTFVSENTSDRLKELDERFNLRDDKGKRIPLPQNEKIERRVLRAAIYTHPEYIRLRTNKAHWKKDHLHKISHSIVETCYKYGIQAIVMGRNKGWKDEVNMKTSNNRNFYSVAHNELQNLIRYKAERYGIVVVETEESYTSKERLNNAANSSALFRRSFILASKGAE